MSAAEKRTNRSARQRKEQYGRAHARAVQLLLRNSCCLEHRGCQHTKLGEVLHHSLASGAKLPASISVAGEEAKVAGVQELADCVREMADMVAAQCLCIRQKLDTLEAAVECLVKAQENTEGKTTEGEAKEEVEEAAEENLAADAVAANMQELFAAEEHDINISSAALGISSGGGGENIKNCEQEGQSSAAEAVAATIQELPEPSAQEEAICEEE